MSTFAVADLHGCYEQWRQIQSFCGDSDRIFVLGDCIDRSLKSLETLKSVLGDSRTTLLCGNHEDMMLQTLIDYFDGENDYGYPWFQNDGYHTFQQWARDGGKKEWISVIKNLPLYATYTNQEGKRILMNHSGAIPKSGFDMSSCGRKALLWDRKCIAETKWHGFDDEILIHGHTPIPLMPQFKRFIDIEIEPGAFWYCDEHKCNIDNASCYTGAVCLLDLNTWEEHIFYGKV